MSECFKWLLTVIMMGAHAFIHTNIYESYTFIHTFMHLNIPYIHTYTYIHTPSQPTSDNTVTHQQLNTPKLTCYGSPTLIIPIGMRCPTCLSQTKTPNLDLTSRNSGRTSCVSHCTTSSPRFSSTHRLLRLVECFCFVV